MAMPTAQPAPPFRLMTSAPLPLVRSKTAFWNPGVHSGNPASGRPLTAALDQIGHHRIAVLAQDERLDLRRGQLEFLRDERTETRVSSIVPRP
jgi:hypothetical protein